MPAFSLATLEKGAIYVAENAALPVAFAASELQRYLRLMTGTHVPIERRTMAHASRLRLGQYEATANCEPCMGPGEFVITPGAGAVVIEAETARAVLDGTYALLEQFGCRWSLHGLHEEQVPTISGKTADLRPLRRAPGFAVRGYSSDIMTWHYTEPEHFGERLQYDRWFVDWMGKSGANAFFFIRHPFDSRSNIGELLPELQRRGINVECGGHVIPLLLPRELYSEHPEFFPELRQGVRSDLGNLCSSSAEALAVVGSNAVHYVREHPEMSALHVWGADLWHGGWCSCGACRSSSVQDQSLRVCNAVAISLGEAGLERPVHYLAYHDTIQPDLQLRPESCVFAEFAPRERCYAHALDDGTCETNRTYAAALQRHLELFEGRVRVFEYYGDAILFCGCAVPLTEVMSADLEYYRRIGVVEITMLQFGVFSLWAYPLNFLVFADAVRGGRGPEGDIETYCAGFGGPGQEVRMLFRELESALRQVVSYGDIRRPPRARGQADPLLARLEAALPRLATVEHRFGDLGGSACGAQAALVAYTRTLLEGVHDQLRHWLTGAQTSAQGRYAEALRIVAGVEHRFKGLWGSVDLPLIHAFYAASDV